MAEGFARAAGIEAYSAGTNPAGYVHPVAVQVMVEKGIDISAQTSKELDLNLAQTMDAVITVCGEADETCPRSHASIAFIGPSRIRPKQPGHKRRFSVFFAACATTSHGG
jgi:protein-tyrosine-phosphatase